jgi:hypothetical protein
MTSKRFILGITFAAITFSVGIYTAKFYSPTSQIDVSSSVGSSIYIPAETSNTRPSPLRERTFPDIRDTKTTVAGKLEIETDSLNWKIVLNGNDVLAGEGSPPQIEKELRKRITPFDEVIVLTDETGTCCEIGPFRFLGLRSNGTFVITEAIGDGFAFHPQISATDEYVKVRIRGGSESSGTGRLPGGEWIFENGQVHHIK